MKHRIKQLALFFCSLIFIGNISFATADTSSDTETLLNWAENNYPKYFPTHQTTQSITPWLFRFYPETNVYVGVNTSDNGVYVFGGPWGNVNPTYIDSLSNLLLAANNGKLTDVISIVVTGSGALGRSFVLKADGSVWGWGYNTFGAIGDGTNIDRLTPVKVVGLTGVTSIVSGANATIALKNDRTVWVWGWNIHGDLGDGTAGMKDFQYTPVEINGLSDVIAIGENNTVTSSGFYAIKKDGTLWIWGCQANEILDHTSIFACLDSSRVPTQISGFSDVIDFKSRGAGGVLNSYFVLKSDGTVWAWGNNFVGQLGDGTNSNTILPHGKTGTNRDTPLQVAELAGVKDIAVVETLAGMMVFALKEDGTLWAWGDNSGRQLGTGITTITVDSPTQVIGLTGITKIAVETNQRFALKNDGTVWAWGDINLYGAVGNGTTTSQLTPIQLVGLTNVIDIKASMQSSHALKGDGTVWAWGLGQLVDGTPVQHLTPTQMGGLAGITDITSPRLSYSTYALRNDGTVWNAYLDAPTQE